MSSVTIIGSLVSQSGVTVQSNAAIGGNLNVAGSISVGGNINAQVISVPPSNWSTFPATSGVDICGNNISNVNGLTVSNLSVETAANMAGNPLFLNGNPGPTLSATGTTLFLTASGGVNDVLSLGTLNNTTQLQVFASGEIRANSDLNMNSHRITDGTGTLALSANTIDLDTAGTVNVSGALNIFGCEISVDSSARLILTASTTLPTIRFTVSGGSKADIYNGDSLTFYTSNLAGGFGIQSIGTQGQIRISGISAATFDSTTIGTTLSALTVNNGTTLSGTTITGPLTMNGQPITDIGGIVIVNGDLSVNGSIFTQSSSVYIGNVKLSQSGANLDIGGSGIAGLTVAGTPFTPNWSGVATSALNMSGNSITDSTGILTLAVSNVAATSNLTVSNVANVSGLTVSNVANVSGLVVSSMFQAKTLFTTLSAVDSDLTQRNLTTSNLTFLFSANIATLSNFSLLQFQFTGGTFEGTTAATNCFTSVYALVGSNASNLSGNTFNTVALQPSNIITIKSLGPTDGNGRYFNLNDTYNPAQTTSGTYPTPGPSCLFKYPTGDNDTIYLYAIGGNAYLGGNDSNHSPVSFQVTGLF